LRGRYFDDSLLGWKWVFQGALHKLFGYNLKSPWPVDHSCEVTNYENVIFDVDDMQIFQRRGIYFQCTNKKIVIGKGTQIAYGVGLITENHNLYDITKHQPGKDIIIGRNCWIGMNAILLPGTVLGDHTIVGAGAVVTKSFPDGHVVIAGNPAKVIRSLNKEDFVERSEDGHDTRLDSQKCKYPPTDTDIWE
jgi:acetyltransferase-like isoleucine patch superfamily enzyme